MAEDLSDFVSSTENVRGGVLCLKDTRIPLSQIIADLACDYKLSEIAQDRGLDLEELKKIIEAIAFQFSQEI